MSQNHVIIVYLRTRTQVYNFSIIIALNLANKQVSAGRLISVPVVLLFSQVGSLALSPVRFGPNDRMIRSAFTCWDYLNSNKHAFCMNLYLRLIRNVKLVSGLYV